VGVRWKNSLGLKGAPMKVILILRHLGLEGISPADNTLGPEEFVGEGTDSTSEGEDSKGETDIYSR